MLISQEEQEKIRRAIAEANGEDLTPNMEGVSEAVKDWIGDRPNYGLRGKDLNGEPVEPWTRYAGKPL